VRRAWCAETEVRSSSLFCGAGQRDAGRRAPARGPVLRERSDRRTTYSPVHTRVNRCSSTTLVFYLQNQLFHTFTTTYIYDKNFIGEYSKRNDDRLTAQHPIALRLKSFCHRPHRIPLVRLHPLRHYDLPQPHLPIPPDRPTPDTKKPPDRLIADTAGPVYPRQTLLSSSSPQKPPGKRNLSHYYTHFLPLVNVQHNYFC